MRVKTGLGKKLKKVAKVAGKAAAEAVLKFIEEERAKRRAR